MGLPAASATAGSHLCCLNNALDYFAVMNYSYSLLQKCPGVSQISQDQQVIPRDLFVSQ